MRGFPSAEQTHRMQCPKITPRRAGIGQLNSRRVFVHPTSSSGEHWNAHLDNRTVNALNTKYPMRLQASAFNIGGRLYTPAYRRRTSAFSRGRTAPAGRPSGGVCRREGFVRALPRAGMTDVPLSLRATAKKLAHAVAASGVLRW